MKARSGATSRVNLISLGISQIRLGHFLWKARHILLFMAVSICFLCLNRYWASFSSFAFWNIFVCFYFAGMKEDVVCQPILMPHTAMVLVILQELLSNVARRVLLHRCTSLLLVRWSFLVSSWSDCWFCCYPQYRLFFLGACKLRCLKKIWSFQVFLL
jgi:hypothetical protein